MKRFLKRLLRFAGYTAAMLVILLAVGVGLFRLFLPRLPQYQDDIEGWASDAIGMEVRFSGMNARWGLSGPELEFYDAELIRPDTRHRLINADRVSIGISVYSLAFDRAFVVDHVTIQDTSIEVRQLQNGDWWIQGLSLDELPTSSSGQQRVGDLEILGEDIEIRFLQPGDERPRFIRVRSALASINKNRIAFDANVKLPGDLGRELTLAATRVLDVPEEERTWDISVEADDVALAGWSELHPALRGRVLSGSGDVDVALEIAATGVTYATAHLDLADISLAAGQAFDLSGRFELDMSFAGWLVAAEEFRIASGDHKWPEASLRAEASTDADGNIAMLDLRASYLNLDDSALVLPLLPAQLREQLAGIAPSGEIRRLVATVSDYASDERQFDVSAELDDVGFAAADERPGIRGFTGQLRANNSGGRLEMRTRNMLVELPQYLDVPVGLLAVEGTILWRSSLDRTTVLSDSIRVTSPVLDSHSNVQLTINHDGSSPDIDLAGTFSIRDVAKVRQYIPRKVIKPKLHDWFEGALLAGAIERGTVRLHGPLDKFPFDNNEGHFLVEGSARNLTFKYQPLWPAAEQADLDIVLDNMRLYSVHNRSMHAGNQAVDINVEIADLRKPVLTISGLLTGTLETLRQFAIDSPVDRLTGGNLRRLSISGDASFNLDLTVPLKNSVNTEFHGLLRSNNGTLAVEGLKAPITDLIGEVEITRDQIRGESLGGRFLGEAVNFRLGPSTDPRFFAIATATGAATATAIVEELGVPLQDLIDGATDYEARILFPRGSQETPPPFTVQIESDLEGLAVALPDPVGKLAGDRMHVRGDIRFIPGGERIESTGSADNGLSWQLIFNKPEGTAWDFDRGVLLAGDGDMVEAETRGLHIRGNTGIVRFDEWLDLSRGGDKKTGVADRIRSVDLTVADLFIVGQHLKNQHVRVDRSARDWLVQTDGEDMIGSVFVPYDFGADRAMVLEMERMHLPGDDVSPPSDSMPDPRSLPPIVLTADDFSLGARNLGSVEVELARTEAGLETEKLIATDETFELIGAGRWVADENEALGSRTYVTATLNSTNVETTLQRLDFAQGISGDTMGIFLDMNWAGGPRADFLDELDGEVAVELKQGQLEEVDPGAGRMLGLISFVALPRRLSLDFRDVFNKGFRYDKIAGTFDVVDGTASTCDLSLEGPAADVGIVGEADLVQSTYNQGAIISAKVGNTLPLVGAVVGGPPGAAAMLIFSRIFKKPLQEVGQVFYGISGPWDEPVIEPVSSEDFVRYGELAGCLEEPAEE